MKKNLFNSVFFSLLLSSTFANAAIIVCGGPLNESEQEAAYSILKRYSGPGALQFHENPASIYSEEFAPLLEPKKASAETDFISKKFKENFPSRALQVKYIPETLWDLHVIYRYLTDKNTQEEYKDIEFSSNSNSKERKIKRFFDLCNEVDKELGGAEDYSLECYKTATIERLKNIYEKSIDKENKFSLSLIKEYNNFLSEGKSILIDSLEQEYKAHLDNNFFLIRATNGVHLMSKRDTRDELESYLKSRRGFSKMSAEQINATLTEYDETPAQWYEYQGNDDVKILDFPLESTSAYESIHKFTQALHQKNPQYSDLDMGKTLSYASSILGGYLFDSFNRSKGACTFAYYADNPNTIVYSLSFGRQWFFSTGKAFIHFPKGDLLTDAVLGSQELFHPRMRKVLPSSKLAVPELDFYSQISTKSVMKDELIKFDDNQYNIQIEDSTFKKEMSVCAHLFLEAAKFLDSSNVIFHNGILTAHANEKELSAAKNILKMQKEITNQLEIKLRASSPN